MINLRDYQTDGINRLRGSLRAGNRAPVFVAPTGSGKTICAASIIVGAVAKGKRVLFLAHRHELCCQAAGKLADIGIEHSVIAQPAGIRQMQIEQFKRLGVSRVKTGSQVEIGMVQTVVRRLDKTHKPDIIIVDECHLSIANTYRTIIEHFKDATLIGLTATPTRLDGVGLGKHAGGLYDDLIVLCQPQYLIDSGFLVTPRIFSSAIMPDLSSIKTKMGDFAQNELAAAVDKPALVGDAVDHYRRVAHNRPAIVFCVSVNHAKHTAEQFTAAGYRAIAVDGDSEDSDRAGAVAGLGDGTWQIVANCGLYIEGLDQTAISCVIDLAPTQSLTRYLQKIGRGLRPHTGKRDCIVLDHAGNTMRHGLPQQDREWTLDGKSKHKKKTEDDPDIKVTTCEKCYSVYATVPTCPNCGHTPEIKIREMEVKDGELIEITAEQITAMQRQKRLEQGSAQTIDQMMKIPGMSRARALKIIDARQAKDALVRECVNQSLGSLGELRRMKPKQLRDMLASTVRLTGFA